MIEFVRTAATGVEEVYQTIKLTNATVSSFRMHINDPPNDRPLEEISFTFQRIEIENRAGKTAAMDD